MISSAFCGTSTDAARRGAGAFALSVPPTTPDAVAPEDDETEFGFDEAAGVGIGGIGTTGVSMIVSPAGTVVDQLPPEPLVPGATIPIEGRQVRLAWEEGGPRAPRLEEFELRCGGPRIGFERRIERFLRARALDLLSADTAHYARLAGVVPRSVGIGDAGTRWGSCSSDGRIRYSWRLILAPEAARRYVAAHEVAHLVHLDHGPNFKALEARLYGPGVTRAKGLLVRHGPRLKRIGRGG